MNKRQQMLWAELRNTPMTALEVAAFLGIAKRNANANLKALREAGFIDKMHLRICDWYTGSEQGRPGYPTPIYTIGRGSDAPRPEPLSGAITSKRHREKYRALYRIKRTGVVSPWAGLPVT